LVRVGWWARYCHGGDQFWTVGGSLRLRSAIARLTHGALEVRRQMLCGRRHGGQIISPSSAAGQSGAAPLNIVVSSAKFFIKPPLQNFKDGVGLGVGRVGAYLNPGLFHPMLPLQQLSFQHFSQCSNKNYYSPKKPQTTSLSLFTFWLLTFT